MLIDEWIKNKPAYCRVEWGKKPSEEQQKIIVLVCPHGSSGEDFLGDFPYVFEGLSSESEALMREYLDIEQDKGSWEWTQEVSRQICRENLDVAVLNVLLDFPRGFLDGGRKTDFCLGEMLPKHVLDLYGSQWKQIQQNIILFLNNIYLHVQKTKGLLVDLHTMAPYCRSQQVPRKYEFLKEYLDSYHEANEKRRVWDLIVGEEGSVVLADGAIVKIMKNVLEDFGIPYSVNDPYPSAPEYLMHLHMSSCPSVALDIPKTEFVKNAEDYRLNDFQIDPERLAYCARPVVEALKRWLEYV